MARYLRKLERELHARGFRGRLYLMHSAGGLLSPETACAFPIRLLESGPAGGGLATAFFGAAAGKADVISFDMGGTTAKACLIQQGAAEIAPMMEAARVHRFKKGSGLPIKAPVIDMIEIGAGGGSVAAIDEVGLLRVGPHSAGADPGPACYGLGGTVPTVTDANLLLGYYDPGFFLGGRMALDRAAAERALGTVGARLGLSAIDTAWGIHRLVVENMAAAARIHIVEKGKDPRAYAMVGFGGAGPAHAAEVARILGVAEVIIPPASGAASALGFLAAPLSFEQVRSHPVRLDAPDAAAVIDQALRALQAEADARLIAAGVAAADIVTERSSDMRLEGQMHEINVPLPDGDITDGVAAGHPCRLRDDLCGAVHLGLWRRRRAGDLVPGAMPWPVPRAVADRSRRAATRRASRRAETCRLQNHAPRLVRRRLRRYTCLQPLRADARRAARRPGDHRGRRGHHRHPARLLGWRRCERQPAHRHRPCRRAHRAGDRRHPARRGRRGDRGRSGFTRNHVEPPGHRRRGDVADRLPHRLQPDRLGGARLRLRPAGCLEASRWPTRRAPCRCST